MSGFELKKISPDGIVHALEKAERYRLLNDPQQAESICQDILAIDPENQEAIVCLLLSLTDQFQSSTGGNAHDARKVIEKLADPYERAYYTGLVYERETRAYLERKNVVRSAAYDGFRHAMDWYEKAEHLAKRGGESLGSAEAFSAAERRAGVIDAILRWNSCVRAIERERLEPAAHEHELPLE